MANDPQVAVRFAVKDAEVVRQALQALGKDGETALRRMDAAAKPVPKGLSSISDVISDLRGRASSLAGSTGIAGTALLGLGPIGLAAAAALGAVYLAFEKVKDGAKAAGQYAREVRDFASATSFSTTEVQALSDAFQRHGIEQDKARAGLEKFAIAREQAKHGDGELYQSLKRTSLAMAEEFAAAQSAPAALGVFIRALQQADDTQQKFLAKTAFGKGSAAFATALLDIAGKGGLGAIEAAAIKTGAALDDALIQKQALAAVEAERKAQIVERNWNAAYGNIYKTWKDFLKNVLGLDSSNSIAISIKVRVATENAGRSIADLTDEGLAAEIDKTQRRLAQIAGGEAGRGRSKNFLNLMDPLGQKDKWKEQLDEFLAERVRRDALAAEAARESVRGTGAAPIEKPRSALDDKADLERSIKIERERLSLLGDTASATELLAAKTNELRLAAMNNAKISKDEIAQVREGYAIQLAARDVALRSQLGVVTATELYNQKVRELNQQLALRKINEQEYADLLKLSRREIDETIKAQEVRRSDFPNLTRLRQEGENLRASLDTELSGALRSTTSDLFAMAKGTKTAGQGFGDMAMKITEAVGQAILLKNVVGPLAGALSSGLGGLLGGAAGGNTYPGAHADIPIASARGNVFDRGLVPVARGGVVDRPTFFRFGAGSTGLMGEAGPEAIVPLHRDSSGRLGVRSAGGGGNVNVTHVVNNYADVQVSNTSRRDGDQLTIETIVQPIAGALANDLARGRGPLAHATPRSSSRLRG